MDLPGSTCTGSGAFTWGPGGGRTPTGVLPPPGVRRPGGRGLAREDVRAAGGAGSPDGPQGASSGEFAYAAVLGEDGAAVVLGGGGEDAVDRVAMEFGEFAGRDRDLGGE